MADMFANLCAAFKGINDRTDMSHWRSPSPWPPDESSIKEYLDRFCQSMPPGYDVRYRDLIGHNAARMADALKEAYASRLNAGWLERDARSYALLRSDSLLGAASAWARDGAATSPQCPVPLAAVQRFEAVVSDFFEAFTQAPFVRKLMPALPPPPLVTFATEPDLGPVSLTADEVRKYTTADIDIVSQPFGYAKVPVLWGLLAHETSGHCAMHRIDGFIDELSRTCASAIGLSKAGINLWDIWAEEAAADVLGLLNVGPSFAVSLGAWLKMSKPTETMNTSISILGPDLTDKHPVDPLRLSVLKGAVGKLVNIGPSRHRWMQTIGAAIADATPGVQSFDLFYGDPLHPRPIRRRELEREAEEIGATIVTNKFASLGHRSIQSMMTWTENDESRAAAVKHVAAKGTETLAVGDADDAHLLAGATLALAEDPSLYPSLNQRLNKAFDESYRRDKIFRGWPD